MSDHHDLRRYADELARRVEEVMSDPSSSTSGGVGTPGRTPQPSYITVELLNEAKAIVRASPLYRRFIDGTPLENDLAVWMADFAAAKLHAQVAPGTGSQDELNYRELYEEAYRAAIRQARIFEPSMDGYAGAMAVVNAAFGGRGIDGAAAVHVADLSARIGQSVAPGTGETPARPDCEQGDCAQHHRDPAAWCYRCRRAKSWNAGTGETPHPPLYLDDELREAFDACMVASGGQRYSAAYDTFWNLLKRRTDGIRSTRREGSGEQNAFTDSGAAAGFSPSPEPPRPLTADESCLRAGRDQQPSTACDSSPHGSDAEGFSRDYLAGVVPPHASQKLEEQKNDDVLTRVDRSCSDRPAGSTAAANEVK